MNKLYEVVSIKLKDNGEFGDQYTEYLGTDLDEANKAKNQTELNYKNLTPYDQKHTTIEARVYDIEEDVNLDTEDEMVDAIIDSIGYGLF